MAAAAKPEDLAAVLCTPDMVTRPTADKGDATVEEEYKPEPGDERTRVAAVSSVDYFASMFRAGYEPTRATRATGDDVGQRRGLGAPQPPSSSPPAASASTASKEARKEAKKQAKLEAKRAAKLEAKRAARAAEKAAKRSRPTDDGSSEGKVKKQRGK